MDKQLQKYTEEEASAALMLLFLAGGAPAQAEIGTAAVEDVQRDQENSSPTPSDATDDLIIDESKLIDETDETLKPNTEATEEEADSSEGDNEELTGFLACYTMDSLIERMTRVALCIEGDAASRNHEESNLRQRLEPFINEEEVHGTKYHARMKRVYASAVDRSFSQQVSRDKNNTASRLSRIRLRNAEQNLRIEAQKLDAKNMAQRMKKALLLNYIQMLHKSLKLKLMDFNRPVKEIVGEYGIGVNK